MTKKLLFVTTILFVVAFVAMAADVSGKWTYQQPSGRGGDPMPVTITLKADGGTVTGSVPGRGRGGQPGTPSEITNGKVDGNKVYFEVKRTTQNGEIVTKYEGEVSGDSMTLKVTRPSMNGGDPMTNTFTATREKS
jgi:hypothetical protein